MYLAMLNEEQKSLFLGLAYTLACADGEYSAQEKEMIETYGHEMEIVFREEMIRPLDDLLQEINAACSLREKKIIIFEIIGLGMADGHYGDEECSIVKNMEELFHVGGEFAPKCEALIEKYIQFQNDINATVLG